MKCLLELVSRNQFSVFYNAVLGKEFFVFDTVQIKYTGISLFTIRDWLMALRSRVLDPDPTLI